MNKLKLALAASLAATLTLSCSGDPEDEDVSGGSGSNTEVYTLKDKTSSQFTYVEEYEDEYCDEGGVLKKETDEETVNYSITNNVMTWEYRWSDDTLNLKGTSNELMGAWTRTKNKAASCKMETDSDGYSWYDCKEGYDITKAVFTATTVAITRDICETDRIKDGEVWEGGDEGWKMRVKDCDSYEIYKGSKIVTVKENRNDVVVSYGGKTCKLTEPSKSQKQAACKKAWDEYQDEDYYWDFIHEFRESFYTCLEKDMPEGFWVEHGGSGGNDYDYCDIYPEYCGGGDDYDYCDMYPEYCGGGDDFDICEIEPSYCEYCYENPNDPGCEYLWDVYGAGKIAAKPALKPVAKPSVKPVAKAKAKAKTKFPLLKKR